jgi:hypothetical protein
MTVSPGESTPSPTSQSASQHPLPRCAWKPTFLPPASPGAIKGFRPSRPITAVPSPRRRARPASRRWAPGAAADVDALVGRIALHDRPREGERPAVVEAAAVARDVVAGGVPRDGAVLEGDRASIIVEAAAVATGVEEAVAEAEDGRVAADGAVLEGERAQEVVEAAAFTASAAADGVPRDGAVLDGERPAVVDAAALIEAAVADDLVGGNGTVLEGERAAVPEAAAAAEDVGPARDGDAVEADRGAADRHHARVTPAHEARLVRARATNRDVTGDRERSGVVPGREGDGGAGGIIERVLDRGIGGAGDCAGCRRLGGRPEDPPGGQHRQEGEAEARGHGRPGPRVTGCAVDGRRRHEGTSFARGGRDDHRGTATLARERSRSGAWCQRANRRRPHAVPMLVTWRRPETPEGRLPCARRSRMW